MMKKLIFLLIVLNCSGCKYLKSQSTPPSDDYLFKSSGLVQGVAATDYDTIHDVSFTLDTQFTIQVGTYTLNHYEYSLVDHNLTFRNKVTILPSGSLTYSLPRIPAIRKNEAYVVQWSN